MLRALHTHDTTPLSVLDAGYSRCYSASKHLECFLLTLVLSFVNPDVKGTVVDLEPYAPTNLNWCAIGASGMGESNYEWSLIDFSDAFKSLAGANSGSTIQASMTLVVVLAGLVAFVM